MIIEGTLGSVDTWRTALHSPAPFLLYACTRNWYLCTLEMSARIQLGAEGQSQGKGSSHSKGQIRVRGRVRDVQCSLCT